MKNTKIWPSRMPQKARERDEAEVDREQHQLDAHQEQDYVLAVDEDARDGDREQDPGEQQVVREADHGSRSDGMLTRRTRSAAPHGNLVPDVLDLEPGALAHRQRDGRDDGDQEHDRRKLERIGVLGVQDCADLGRVARPVCNRGWQRPAARSPSRRTHSDVSEFDDHDEAIRAPSGAFCANPSRSCSMLMSSIITTNRNSTITAPT